MRFFRQLDLKRKIIILTSAFLVVALIVTTLILVFIQFAPARGRSGSGGNIVGGSKRIDDEYAEEKIDQDGDFLSDEEENKIGTDPLKIDTDDDGIDDYIEYTVLEGYSPIHADSDNNEVMDGDEDADFDGVTNIDEIAGFLDLINPDTDSDGLIDGVEIGEIGTDPLKYDTDEDGLSDGDEVRLGTNPHLADTDGDGILDGKEKFKQKVDIDLKNFGEYIINVVIDFSATGFAENQTSVVPLIDYTNTFFDVPGIMGFPLKIESKSEFDQAIVAISYDDTNMTIEDEKNLGILHFDEETGAMELLEVTYDPNSNTIQSKVEHFSVFLVVDKRVWEESWREAIVYRDSSLGSEYLLDVVLIIDCSESMLENDPNSHRIDASQEFVNALIEGDRSGVVFMETNATLAQALTEDKQSTLDMLSYIYSDGMTNIFGSLNLATSELEDNKIDKRQQVIILLSDGIHNEGPEDYDVLERAKKAGIMIHTVELGADADTVLLDEIATLTSGTHYTLQEASGLVDIYNRISESIEISPKDSDGDGLYDVFEEKGMKNQSGQIIYSNPNKKDSDGDGIADNIEMGKMITFEIPLAKDVIYFAMVSNPNKADSDNDGILDNVDKYPLEPLSVTLNDKGVYFGKDLSIEVVAKRLGVLTNNPKSFDVNNETDIRIIQGYFNYYFSDALSPLITSPKSSVTYPVKVNGNYDKRTANGLTYILSVLNIEELKKDNSLEAYPINCLKKNEIPFLMMANCEGKKVASDVATAVKHSRSSRSTVYFFENNAHELAGLKIKSPLESTNMRIASLFGIRKLNSDSPKLHKGVDICASGADEKIVAPIVANVDEIDDEGETAAGKFVTLSFEYNSTTFFMRFLHLSTIDSKLFEGKDIGQGELIGVMGSTGGEYDIHLHFEIYKNKTYYNPLQFFDRVDIINIKP